MERVRRLGPLLRRDLLPAVRRVDVGRRLARQARREREHGPRLRRLRRLRRRAHDGRHRRPRRRARARAADRQVRTRTASRGRSPGTTSRWRCSARSSCCSAGSASTRRRRFAATDNRFAVIATNTAIAAAFGAVVAMFWVQMRHRRQARSGHDGQRHARRPGRDHRAVRVRAAVGGRGRSASSPASSSSSRCGSSRSAASTTRSARSRCTASAARGACWPSGIFADGSYGVGWNGSLANDAKGVTGILYGGSGGGQLAAQVDRRAHDRHRDGRHRLRRSSTSRTR